MRDGQRLESLEAHPLFPLVRTIVARLKQDGYFTVLAGGCVRDALLGLNPKDMDLATSAPPDAIEKAFARTLSVGKAFGTIVVVLDGHNFEVTTFRRDGAYLDGRKPETVEFTGPEEDARRRDFTVNAIFYDVDRGQVVDYCGGQKDLARGILRAVGIAEARFSEDRLRMLRAVRFAGQLGFDVDVDAKAAILSGYREIAKVSTERIFAELRRLLESAHFVKGLRELLDSRMHEVFWPEVEGLDPSRLTVFGKFLNWEHAFAAICVTLGIENPEARLKALKVPRDSMRRIQSLITGVKLFSDARSTRADRARVFGGEIYAEFVLLAQGLFEEKRLKKWIEEYLEVADGEGRLPKPYVDGQDLLSLGISPGQEMGALIKKVYDAQLEMRVRSKSEALSELKRLRAT